MTYNIQKLPREKVFRDPIHNYIHVQHKVILDLINTREFQRLRRVKQLGTSSFTFQGAEHSRFTHCMGVYEITRLICDNFKRNYPSQSPNDGLWDDNERIVALCAALLHDLGHGPYSHAFEHIFNTDHEQWTQTIITSPETEINQVLRQVSPEFPEKVASVIAKTYKNAQVVQMISSQIDADRMDYLLRDAYFTGTKYGMFDLTRILRVMRPYQGGIAFDANGMHAVEDYVLSRFQMYQQVYFHPVSRGMEVVLTKLLRRAKDLYEHNQMNGFEMPSLLVPFFENTVTTEDYLSLDDGILNTYFTLWLGYPDEILKDLSYRFLNRKPFKSAQYTEESEYKLPELANIVEAAGFDKSYYTSTNTSYDLPYDVYNPREHKSRTQIEIMQNDGSLIELSTLSTLVNALTGKNLGDERFYFPKAMLQEHPDDIFSEEYIKFQKHIYNDMII
ncbi:HD domain-containing protein [Companilactobacillus mishanensis]|uniref:HD domain-containing protein n=1 Tax=Companilactobacillus mishanensis TaxID=2486008 RepID=A0A5P0ZH91_9LACO|nr:HD domain-containing protein [Companilactobacillus mishanensis]MQS44966.1 HD domain-containing protein [Companilactobacillus mishanensis]MQS52355.1 HD domain-containing protein [Companilactobacillus mishanensis]MQS89481.1 HD domain-containing protein [Companilactobacillus mishanensis]